MLLRHPPRFNYSLYLHTLARTCPAHAGKPLFGTLISLLHRGVPVLGIIDQPITKERWLGVAGQGTTLNGQPLATRPCGDVGDAYLYCTTPHMFEGDGVAAWERLRDRVRATAMFNLKISVQMAATATRTALDALNESTLLVALPRPMKCHAQVRIPLYGCDCYAYGLLAGGHCDLVCEADLKPYDYMALVPIVQGAGGVISDWRVRISPSLLPSLRLHGTGAGQGAS